MFSCRPRLGLLFFINSPTKHVGDARVKPQRHLIAVDDLDEHQVIQNDRLDGLTRSPSSSR